MSIETYLLPLLSLVIVIELFFMYLMHVRIQQLMGEVDRMSSKMALTDVELDVLTKNIEEFKRLQL